jgi:type II secretory pathway pseudopilin PulG
MPKLKTRNHHQPGFMLIEVLLALLFSATLAALLLVTASTLTQTYKSNMQSVAARIATTEVENLRKTSYASLPSSGSFTDPDLAKLTSSSATLTMSSYLGSPDIKQATVNITWIQNSSPRQVILETLIYKNGI